MKFGKNYPCENEDKSRMEIFLENRRIIDEHNEQFAKGIVTYEMGLNKYSDRSADEFLTRMRSSDLLG